MELIRQNPYHVIGILAGANQRTIAKQKAIINAFQKVGKSIEFETDLEFTGKPDRSNGAIEKAFANIEINQNKLFNAFFWFTNHNHLDETALTYLQSGNLEKAEEIWQKTTNGKEVSAKNYTAFNNLSTLKLATVFANSSVNLENFKEGVRLKTELIVSGIFNEFCHLVTDETYTVNQDKELEVFVNALLEETNKQKSTDAKKIPSLLSQVHPKLKSLVSEKLTDIPLHNIERKIEQVKKKRTDGPEGGLQLGKTLYQDTKNDLTSLSELLGKSDLKYKMIANKLAKELLQCGIDYFKEFQDREEEHNSGGISKEHAKYAGGLELDLGEDNLGSAVMKLFKSIRSIAVGSQTGERIDENIKGLQEWIDNTNERKKQKLIDEDLKFIASKLESFQNMPDTIANADNLVSSCKPKLQKMKATLGVNDAFYLKISSAVVNNGQGMLVSVVNARTKDFQSAKDYQKHFRNRVDFEVIAMREVQAQQNLESTISDALSVSIRLGELDMFPELRTRYNQNHSSLKSISSQLSLAGSPPSRGPSGGCYIATMAYGSYEHPQVLQLRKFRDESLKKSCAGKAFIQFYYCLSPKLVKVLHERKEINSFIRKILDRLINYIK